MAGGPLHDAAWSRTLDVWKDPSTGGDLTLAVLPPGTRRRGEPPPWWFGSGDDVLIIDGFLDAAEIAAIVKQMPCPSEAVDGGGIIINGRSYGKEARANVDVDASIEARIEDALSRGPASLWEAASRLVHP